MRTAEFVTPRHPDKMCDQISDAVLDWALGIDPEARVAIETLGGHGKVYVVGELTLKDYNGAGHLMPTAIKNAVHRITGDPTLEVITNIVQQSPEIAGGVDTGGGGDQGIMRGYATSETPQYMPKEHVLARSLAQYLYEIYPFDGKTQVTVDDDLNPTVVVASFQNTNSHALAGEVRKWLSAMGYDGESVYVLANPAGNWTRGGFDADTGLTGRKLVVDNYGPRRALGGGCFSGKDATKVDRSAAYMARRIAVDLLREHEAKEVSVELAYAIGVAKPVEATAVIDGITLDLRDSKWDLTPKGIIDFLGLRQPIFEATAWWGHFGNGFNWDRV